jgi:hypothetical protein
MRLGILDPISPRYFSIVMTRLNQAAFDLLDAELKRCISGSSADLAYHFAYGRLQRLCEAEGHPVTYKELRKTLIDVAPKIRNSVLRKAAAVNCPKIKSTLRVKQNSANLLAHLSGWLGWHPVALGGAIGTMGLVALPFMHWKLPGVSTLSIPTLSIPIPTEVVTEVEVPRSGELIQTATTFAGITQQSMKAKALSAQEWQTIVNQWQEAIDLLKQVSADAPDHKIAQSLIQQYQQQQTHARRQLQAEKASASALKVAKARVNWFANKAKKMNPQERAKAIQQIDRQLQPVTPNTTGYDDGKALLTKMKQQMR